MAFGGHMKAGRLAIGCAAMVAMAGAAEPEADYSADRDFVRAFRAGTVEIAKRKMAAGNPNLISTGGGFTGFFVWDSAFAVLWARHAANEGFPVFANLDALYSHQREDGFICREFTKEGEPCWKPEHPWAFNPPILAWAEVELYRSGVSDAKRIAKVYPKLVRFHESYEKYLKRDDGLYFSDALGCGMDDLPRMPRDVKPEEWKRGGIQPTAECVDGNRRDHLWHWLSTAWNLNQHWWNRQAGWIDMSAQMAFDCLNLSELARAVGLDAEARRWTARHDEIAARVNALCWDEEKGFYFDRWGDKIGSRYTVAAFWTLLARIPSEAQARRMAAALDDPRLFDTKVPVTSLAVSDPGYHDTGYWVGSSWPPTTYMVIRGLRAYGLEEQAERIAKKWYNANAKIWVKEKTVREHVRSRSGKGEGGRDFCGWSALVSIALPAEMGWLSGGTGTEDVQKLKVAGFEEANMSLGKGEEFPGARASLVRTNEMTRFCFDFTKGGNYVTMRLGQLQDGARSVSCQCRLDCPSKANFWIRAHDSKGDVYIASLPKPLQPSNGWLSVTHDLKRLGWARGRSTNKVDRATVKYPIHAEIMVEPHKRGLKGAVEMKDLVIATTNRVGQRDWSFSCGAARFGQAYLPDENAAVKASLRSLRTDGAEPAMRLEKAVITDWQDREVLVKKCSGDITLTADELKGQFGAFRVTFWGRDQGSGIRDQVGEKKLGETWFARLTGVSKPVAWVGTGLHGWSMDTRRYDVIAKAGIGTVRNDIQGWPEWEREKGVYSCPRGFRETIDKMHSLGIEMNLILNGLNPIYGEKLDFDAFCNWVRYVVSHEGKDVEYYEVWNEPNNFYFGPKLRKTFFASFVTFTKQVVKTIREVKPEANIEVVVEDGPWHTTVFLRKGIATPKEILSIHPYIHDKNPRPEHCHFYFRDDGKAIQASMASNGVTRVRMTEIGWTTYAADEHGKTEQWYVGAYPGVHFDQQAYYMIRAYLLARTYGVESMMQYDFQNDGPKRNYTEHNFGMVFGDCTPKPSYAAVAFMTRLLGEAEPLGFVGERQAKVSTVCAFRLKDGRKAYAMWAYQDPVEAEIPSDVRGGFVFDLMGNREKLGSRTKLTLTESPVYVVERK